MEISFSASIFAPTFCLTQFSFLEIMRTAGISIVVQVLLFCFFKIENILGLFTRYSKIHSFFLLPFVLLSFSFVHSLLSHLILLPEFPSFPIMAYCFPYIFLPLNFLLSPFSLYILYLKPHFAILFSPFLSPSMFSLVPFLLFTYTILVCFV